MQLPFVELKSLPRRLYAIGDIHGCLDELRVLLDYLRTKCQLSDEDRVVFIGDYIDRGPNSRGVIEELIRFRSDFPGTIYLRGNHEDMLLGFLGLDLPRAPYLMNGGGIFFTSYGFAHIQQGEEALKLLPPEHVAFIQSTERMVVSEKFVLVHAGIDPVRTLEQQVDEDLFWIRDTFLNNIHRLEKLVVFGHTPFEDIFLHLPYKLGLDTGLVYGGMLSCVELINLHVFQVPSGGDKVRLSSVSEKLKRR